MRLTLSNTAPYISLLHFALILALLSFPKKTDAHEVAVSSNVIYWATSTPNLGLEFQLSDRFSLSLAGGYNNFNFPSRINAMGNETNPKLHHWLFMPEARRWTHHAIGRSYFGLHLIGGQYNIGGIKFIPALRDNRYDGFLLGAGLSFGRRWHFSSNWAFELSAGVGYAYLKYNKFDCGSCGRRLRSSHRHYAGPTKLAISFIYQFSTQKSSQKSAVNALFEEELLKIHRVDTLRITDTIYIDAPYKKLPILAPADTARFAIRYPVDSSGLYTSFSTNPSEFSRLDSLLNLLDGDSMKIKSISVIGYASPEHEADYNSTLSFRRATAVANFIMQNDFIRRHHDLISVTGLGEDRQGLIAILANLNSPEAKKILSFIDSNGYTDATDRELRRRFPDFYRQILSDIYPSLRRTEIEIIYSH